MFDADFVRMFTTDEVSKDVVRVVMESILDGSKLAPYPYVSSMKNYGIDKDGARVRCHDCRSLVRVGLQ